MALTQIDSYSVPHDKGGGSGGNTYITGGRKSSTYNSLNVNSINAKFGNIDNLQSQSISANNGMILYLQSKDGMITKISGDQLDYKNGYIGSLVADDIGVKKLKADDIEAMNAFIKTLQSQNITTEYLTVTKQAHFFELIIDKIRSVGGQLIITPASCVADYVKGHIPGTGLVKPTESNYDSIDYFVIYWRAEDEDGRSVDNGFIADEHGNDQAICQSFNNVNEGSNYDVSNKYYWRLVEAIDNDIYINLTTGAEMSLEEGAHEENKNNEYVIKMFDTQTKKDENEYYNNGINWTVTQQKFIDRDGNEIFGIKTNVDWIDGSKINGMAVNGTFVSASQVYGIQITPDKDNLTSNLEFNITQKVGDTAIIPTKINIGVYFKDDTFKIWNNVPIETEGRNFGYCKLDLEDADAPVEAIIIVSTADVNWHRCHRMKLSNINNNEYNGKDDELDGYTNIPSVGDNIVQLGYRTKYDNPDDDPNINRQSAIIISAYKSIDQGGILEDDTIVRPIVAPSYAQYMGIDDFHLYTHRQSFIDGSGARFIGDISLCSVNGKALTDTIQDNVKMLLVDTASVMMNTQEGSNNVTSLTPSTINIQMLTVEDDETKYSYEVPEGYKVRLIYFNASGTAVQNVTYGRGETAGYSLRNISLLMDSNVNAVSRLQITLDKYVTSGGITKLIIIDSKEIPYIRTASATTAGRYEFRYCNYIPTQSDPLPSPPDDYSDGIGTFGEQIKCSWNTSVVSPNAANGEYTYMSQIFRNAAGSYVGSGNGEWSTPIRITGANGRDGEDGSDIEYIYCQKQDRWNTPTAPTLADDPTIAQNDWPNIDGQTPSKTIGNTTWWDNPQGVSENIKFEYVSMRQKSHGGNWSEYCTPVIWSNWGLKGQDGDGYEYIFRLTNEPSSSNIENPCDVMTRAGLNWQTDSTYQSSNEYVTHMPNPDNVAAAYWWMDDPSSVTQTHPYLYVSVRQRKSGQGWSKFSDPALWARYAEQGETGGHYAFRYKNSKTQPTVKPIDTGFNNGWSDIPTNPDIANGEYTWMSQTFVTPATPNDSYGTWSDPVRITGGDGTPGTDGTDIEFIYALSVNNTQIIPAPPTNQIDDWPNDGNTDHQTITNSNGTQTTWYDNPQGVTNIVKCEWMSMRYKTGGHNGVGGTWSAYTTPVIWSAYGDKGMDGDGFEYIYRVTGGSTAESNKPANPTPNDWATNTSYQDDPSRASYVEYIPTDWHDDPQNTSATNRWQWVCVRKRRNGQWKQFEGPTLWSNYSLADQAVPGSDGKDAELNILVPYKENFYADIKTALTNNSKTKLKMNLEYGLNKKVGTDVTSQSWTGYELYFDLYSSTYRKLTSNSIRINTSISGGKLGYTNNDILYAISSNNVDNKSWGSNTDWLALSSDKTVENGTAIWLKLPVYAEVTLYKRINNSLKIMAEPRIVPLQIDGGAFQLVTDKKIQSVVGDTIYGYNGGLESYLQDSYASTTMLANMVTTKVNTLTMSKTAIENALSEVTQTANEYSVNITNQYTNDITTRLANAGITIAANNTDGGHIELNADNTNVNGSLNVYDTGGEGFKVWNGSKNNATKSVQISNKELGQVQNFVVQNVTGSSNKYVNVIGIDGAAFMSDYNRFMWWGKSGAPSGGANAGFSNNPHEFIVRNYNHNMRVREDGIFRSVAEYDETDPNDSNHPNDTMQNTNTYRTGGKDIIQDSYDHKCWGDISSTVPVYCFTGSTSHTKDFTTDGNGHAGSYPDANFKKCGIFVCESNRPDSRRESGDVTVYLPHPGECNGRVVVFKALDVNANGEQDGLFDLKLTVHGNYKCFMRAQDCNCYNYLYTNRKTVQLVAAKAYWIELKSV